MGMESSRQVAIFQIVRREVWRSWRKDLIKEKLWLELQIKVANFVSVVWRVTSDRGRSTLAMIGQWTGRRSSRSRGGWAIMPELWSRSLASVNLMVLTMSGEWRGHTSRNVTPFQSSSCFQGSQGEGGYWGSQDKTSMWSKEVFKW